MKTTTAHFLSCGNSSFIQFLTCFATLAGLFITPSPAKAEVVNLYTGDSTYSVPIVIPPGTNGVAPSLALNYNSNGENDWIGQGWQLSGLGYIEQRGPNYSPVPTHNPDIDTYVLVLGGSSYKLVEVGHDLIYRTISYRTENESFLRISRPDNSVVPAQGWSVGDRAGNVYIFGYGGGIGSTVTNVSRQFPPSSPNNVFRWYLDSARDSHNVYWNVSYSQDLVSGDMYPKQIVYSTGGGGQCTTQNLTACRTIDFITEPRPDPIVSYAHGGQIVSDQRLKRIDVKLGGQLVRAYTLAYTQRAATARGYAAVSQLASVTETGADGVTSLPATTFVYHVDANGANNTLTQTSMAVSPAEGLTGCTFPVDMNGDGRADILVGQAGSYAYYLNQGNGSYGARTLRFPRINCLFFNNLMDSLTAKTEHAWHVVPRFSLSRRRSEAYHACKSDCSASFRTVLNKNARQASRGTATGDDGTPARRRHQPIGHCPLS